MQSIINDPSKKTAKNIASPPCLPYYQLKIEGTLNADWAEWFDLMDIQKGNGHTLITGPIPDQAALRGILNRIFDLNLILIYIIRINKGR